MATPLKLAGAALPGSEHALPPGTRVGGVVIDSVLSVGEYGIVYHAVDPMLRRAVALKEYFAPAFSVRDAEGQVSPRSPADAAAFNTGRQAFVEEARLLAHLAVPGLLSVTGLFEDHGTVFRLMPHAPGRTLASWRAMYSDTMDEGGLRHLLSDLMGPLEALHAANLVHGYVLPEQVILAEGRPALLLGFGTVRRSLQGALDPAFTPVEQLPSGGHLPRGAWSDVYALAALARFAMSAQPVMASADPPTAHALRTRAPMGHALSHALERALAPTPGDRPQSIAALRQAMGLRPSGMPGTGTVDVTLPGDEPFDATATRPWPQPSIGASLRASSLRSAVAEQSAMAGTMRMSTPARPARFAGPPAPSASPDAMATLPLPGRPSNHDAGLAADVLGPGQRAWDDTPPASAPLFQPPVPTAPMAPAGLAPAQPPARHEPPPANEPEPAPVPAPATIDAPQPAAAPQAQAGPHDELPPIGHHTTVGEPSLEPSAAISASLTAGPREPAFGPEPVATARDDAPEHDPIPQFMATASAQGLQEPRFHPLPAAAPPAAPLPEPVVHEPEVSFDPMPAPAPVAPAQPVPAPVAPLDFQPIELPAGWVPRDKPEKSEKSEKSERPAKAEEPIDDAVRAAIAAAIGSLPPAPPRRPLGPDGMPQGAPPAEQGLRMEMPDFSALQAAPPQTHTEHPQDAAPRPAGLSPRARIAAVVVAVLLLVVIGAVAWSAWKDATLNLTGGG